VNKDPMKSLARGVGSVRGTGPFPLDLKGRRPAFLVLTLLVVAGLVTMQWAGAGWVLVLFTPEGRILQAYPLPKAGNFQIAYTHSVNHFPIVEWFEVETDGAIYVVQEDFTAFGAGIGQVDNEGHLVVEDGWMKLKNLHRYVGVIRLRVGWVANQRLVIGSREIELTGLAPGGARIDMRVERWGGLPRILVAGGPLKGVWLWTSGLR